MKNLEQSRVLTLIQKIVQCPLRSAAQCCLTICETADIDASIKLNILLINSLKTLAFEILLAMNLVLSVPNG